MFIFRPFQTDTLPVVPTGSRMSGSGPTGLLHLWVRVGVLLVEETRVPVENHRPAASHWQTLSHNVVLSTPRHECVTLMSLGGKM
jgi:hypothetical protein